jgi:ABC-type dipeptide/oligopeptide/nickel transport system permease subunit
MKSLACRRLCSCWPWLFFLLLLSGWWIGRDGGVDLAHRLQGPQPPHLLGTDELGRDIGRRFLLGGARSLSLAMVVTALNLGMGVLLALICQPFRLLRWSLLAVSDLLASIPSTLLALLLLALLRPGIGSLLLALVVGGWIPFARLTINRLDVLATDPSLIQLRLMGAGRLHRLFRHLLPRLWNLLGTQASVGLGSVIMVEGGLSFLGLGLPPQMASWGTMLASGRTFLLVSPWGLLWPAMGLLWLLLAADVLRRRLGSL